jgi:hypothetical protein
MFTVSSAREAETWARILTAQIEGWECSEYPERAQKLSELRRDLEYCQKMSEVLGAPATEQGDDNI